MDRDEATAEAQVMTLWDSGFSKRRIQSMLGMDGERVRNIVHRLDGGAGDRQREKSIRDGCRRYGVALARTGKVYA